MPPLVATTRLRTHAPLAPRPVAATTPAASSSSATVSLLADRRRSYLGNAATEAMAQRLADRSGDLPAPAPMPAMPVSAPPAGAPPAPVATADTLSERPATDDPSATPIAAEPAAIAPAGEAQVAAPGEAAAPAVATPGEAAAPAVETGGNAVAPTSGAAAAFDLSIGGTETAADTEADIHAWRARTVGAAIAIPAPTLPRAPLVLGAVHDRGAALRRARAGGRGGIAAEAAAATPTAPVVHEQPAPPPIEPVPAATALVTAQTGQHLSPAVLPDTVRSPRGTQPLVRDPELAPDPAPASSSAASIDPLRSTLLDGDDTLSSEMAPESSTSDAVCRAIEAPAPVMVPGTAEGATIIDTDPPAAPPVPPAMQQVMAIVATRMRDAIARLLVDPGEQARGILFAARDEAYPNGVLGQVYPDIGGDRLPEVTTGLTEALRAVAAEAGIAADALDTAISQRRLDLEVAAAEASGALCSTATDETMLMSQASGDEMAMIDAARDGEIAHADAISSAAESDFSPTAIDARRDGQIGRIATATGRLRFDYDQARINRHALLDRQLTLYNQAYDETATADQGAVDAAARPETAYQDLLEKGGIRNWATEQKRAAATQIRALKTSATAEAEGFRTDAALAGVNAIQMVRDWAAEQKGEVACWFDDFSAQYDDWALIAAAEAANWASQRAGETRDAAMADMGVLGAFVAQQGEAVDLDHNAAFAALAGEQQAVVRAYYASAAGNRDTLGAVAAGLRYRISAQQRETLITAMKAEVMAKPDDEAANLEQIGQAETPGFSAVTIVDQLYEAMFGGVTGIGTDEEQIYSSLAGLTPLQGRAVRAMYRHEHESDLDADLRSELDENIDLVRAMGALDGDVVTEAVGALRDAMHGGITGIGTDEALIMRTLRGKTEEQRQQIIAEYQRRYGEDLTADLHSELSDHDRGRADALLTGETARADAIALDQAMHGGLFGLGTDEGQIDEVYADIRNDVAGERIDDGHRGTRLMTRDEMEAAVARRNADVETAYDTRYGTAGDGESALRTAFRSELSGAELHVAIGLADNDMVAVDAARLEVERRSLFYTDDGVVNGILDQQYERALETVRRNPATTARRDALERMAREQHWDLYRLAAEQRLIDRSIEADARGIAATGMAVLNQRYDAAYNEGRGGGLDRMLRFHLTGTDRERARALLTQGSLSRAQEIDFATRGAGTDEAAFRRATTGLTAAEIRDLNRDLAALGRGTVQDIAADELDGRDGFDMTITLRGVPEDAAEEMAQARDRAEWELRNSPVGGHSRDVLSRRLDAMQAQFDLINDPGASPAARRRALDQFHSRATGIGSGVESFRHHVDAWTDAIATGVSLVAAIAVTIATGGIAGAVLGALYAAVLSMSIKAIMKGNAYGGEEMAVDAFVGIVDAAAAAATFGVGNALLRVAEKGISARVARLGSSRLAAALERMAASGSRVQRVIAHGVAEAAEGAAGALPSALAGNMINDQNWEHGNPLANIIGGTITETGFGAAMGGVIGGGIAAFSGHTPHIRPREPGGGDILAHRGTPADRAAAWHEFRAANPDASKRAFLTHYDEGIARSIAAANADAAIQRRLRGELLAGIPHGERAAFAGARIEIMADADFRALTRSDSAHAVTLIEGGEARVILREGRPIAVLREEGIHLHQLADPELGPIARRLDEAKLRQWDSLSIGEQLELYSAKLTLEIDAQHRMIASLADDLRRTGPASNAESIARQLQGAESSLATLRARADEIAGFSIMDRIAMAHGLRDPPGYLDQPARLFNKRAAKGDPSLPRHLLPEAGNLSSPVHRDVSFVKNDGSGAAHDRVHRVGPEWPETSHIKLAEGAQVVAGSTTLTVKGNQLMDANGGPVSFAAGTSVTVNGRPATIRSGTTIEVTQRYREIEWIHADGRIENRFEAMSLSHDKLDERGWVQRGSDSVAKGSAAEVASRRLSEQRLASGQIAGVADVRNPGGTGFDGAEIRIVNGVPVLTLIEVKNYAGRYVPFEDFTAIRENFADNLVALRERLEPAADLIDDLGMTEAIKRHAAELEMPLDTLLHMRRAIGEGRVELEIRLGPTTSLGVQGADSAFNRLWRAWRGFGQSLDLHGRKKPQIGKLSKTLMDEGEAAIATVAASRTTAGATELHEPLIPFGETGQFVDAKGALLAVRHLSSAECTPATTAALANGIVDQLMAHVTVPGGSQQLPSIGLDLSLLSAAQRLQLQAAIDNSIAMRGNAAAIASRLFFIHNPH